MGWAPHYHWWVKGLCSLYSWLWKPREVSACHHPKEMSVRSSIMIFFIFIVFYFIMIQFFRLRCWKCLFKCVWCLNALAENMCHSNMEIREGRKVCSIGHCTGKRRHCATCNAQREVVECLGLESKCSEPGNPHMEVLLFLKKVMSVVCAELSKDPIFEA